MDAHTHNLLLTLSYFWFADARQLQRLHFPDLALKTVKHRLKRLADLGLIKRSDPWNDSHGPALAMWSLTNKGHQAIVRDPAYPGKCKSRSATYYEHDRRTLNVVVWLIEAARLKGISGIRIWREIKLNPKATKPKCDAVVIFEVGASTIGGDTIPWSLAKPLDSDGLWRCAIEGDNHSQSMQILAEKAQAYKRVGEDQAWYDHWVRQFGKLPSVYVVTDEHERAAEIADVWAKEWPTGHWATSWDDGLWLEDRETGEGERRNIWLYHYPDNQIKRTSMEYRTPAELEQLRAQREQEKAAEAARKAQAAAEAARPTHPVLATEPAPPRPSAAPATPRPAPAAPPPETAAERQARERREFELRPPRPIEELVRIVPWKKDQRVEFEPDGTIKIVEGRLHSTIHSTKFNTAERAIYSSYAWEALTATNRAEEEAAAAEQKRIADGKRAARRTFTMAFVLPPLILALAWAWRSYRDRPDFARAIPQIPPAGVVQCVEATAPIMVYRELAAVRRGAPAGQMQTGDELVWVAFQPLEQQPTDRFIWVGRREEGRVIWQAWAPVSGVKECDR